MSVDTRTFDLAFIINILGRPRVGLGHQVLWLCTGGSLDQGGTAYNTESVWSDMPQSSHWNLPASQTWMPNREQTTLHAEPHTVPLTYTDLRHCAECAMFSGCHRRNRECDSETHWKQECSRHLYASLIPIRSFVGADYQCQLRCFM